MKPEEPAGDMPERRKPRCVRVKLNPLISSVSGNLGDLKFFTNKEGQTFVRPKIKRDWPLTPKEKDYHRRFERAVIYARKILANPKKKAVYEAAAAARQTRPFAFAVMDKMRFPKVIAIDPRSYTGKKGQLIYFYAEDDFEFKRVHLTLRHPIGEILEEGIAKKPKGCSRWEYQTQKDIPSLDAIEIDIEVKDRAGNSTLATARYSFSQPAATSEGPPPLPQIAHRNLMTRQR